MRLGISALVLAIGLASLALFAAPAGAATTPCGEGYSASGIKAGGVTCAQAKKVVKEYQTRSQCKGKPCTFTKVGVKWSCQSPRPFHNVCRATKRTASGKKNLLVSWEFSGEH
jgi:hypothetical protein